MSWSHVMSGDALEVAREVEKQSEVVQPSLSNRAEKAIHARVVALIVVACHEQRGHNVQVEAYGHFDGVRQHFSCKVDGIEASVVEKRVEEDMKAAGLEVPVEKETIKTKRRK